MAELAASARKVLDMLAAWWDERERSPRCPLVVLELADRNLPGLHARQINTPSLQPLCCDFHVAFLGSGTPLRFRRSCSCRHRGGLAHVVVHR